MPTTITKKGNDSVGYETKVILKAVVSLMRRSKDLEEAIQLVTDIANAEDVIIEPESTSEKKD